ncbi:hypothetical protein HI914_07519 [Erysiphe necator]|uniref:Uncharacterized protein n=1 Tax=Uncinula necator TaxID=52586 RepID=A0A0B1PG09_UNCNE|nr:hypothetical protein HI914_07519 [Erysiphe necator]KHJ35529.1 hypothetical protein EV44_g0873 [Erysiphe necator]
MSGNSNGPAIFMDSHPEEQDGYLKSWITSLRTNLTIAATGIVERVQKPGELRLKWVTHEGTTGFKDYDLKDYEQVRNDFHEVLTLPDVHRAMILGYPSQNPYIVINGKNPWVERFEREKLQKERMTREQNEREAKVAAMGEGILNIDALVRDTEIEERKRIQQEMEVEARKLEEARKRRQQSAKEKFADEEEGLLSGHM